MPAACAKNFYARWRRQSVPAAALSDDGDVPSESLVQLIWQHQRLRRDALTTLDGQRLQVLHPGFVSVEGGPDFRGAVIRVGEGQPVSGDVEVDLRPAGWRDHGHDQNSGFRNVVLHVVWEGGTAPKGPPALAVAGLLDAPARELAEELAHHSLRVWPEALRGKCCAPLRELAPEDVGLLLTEAALVRLQTKAGRFSIRARHVGWEQALWEGLFRGLGYKHNTWPMQHLAEHRAAWGAPGSSVESLQARLLGLSGLLPTELIRTRSGGDEFLQRAWQQWWRERDGFAGIELPRKAWRFHGLRPANHPQRRLAIVAHWLARRNFVAQLEAWGQAAPATGAGFPALQKILSAPGDGFWSWHWTLHSARLAKPQVLLGAGRATDLALNAILPWLWARADSGRRTKLAREIEARYLVWPAAEDNAGLRVARQRLLGGVRPGHPARRYAAAQQGLLQIAQDFCERSNALCDGCRFPELVQQWQRQQGGA